MCYTWAILDLQPMLTFCHFSLSTFINYVVLICVGQQQEASAVTNRRPLEVTTTYTVAHMHTLVYM